VFAPHASSIKRTNLNLKRVVILRFEAGFMHNKIEQTPA